MTEILKVLLEGLKKQGFSVMLLFGVSTGLWVMMGSQKEELTAAINVREAKCEQIINELKNQNFDCQRALTDAEIRIARLEALQIKIK